MTSDAHSEAPSLPNAPTTTDGADDKNHNVTVTHVIMGKDNQLLLDYNGLERILLTANGNLQRMFSAYFHEPIYVDILRNIQCSPTPTDATSTNKAFKRCVLLQMGKERVNLGIAFTQLTLEHSDHIRFYVDENPGLGQFFHHFHLLPSFELVSVGRNMGACLSQESMPTLLTSDDVTLIQQTTQNWSRQLWRRYTLQACGVYCDILEILRNDVFPLSP